MTTTNPLMLLNVFTRLRARARRAYFDSLTFDERRVGETGQPEVKVLKGQEPTWVPMAYCIRTEFGPDELKEMTKICAMKPQEESANA